jgi:hypothetical protein
MQHVLRLALLSFFLVASSAAPVLAGQYKNFRVAVYCVVDATQRFADENVLQAEFDRVMARVKFDKVYLEVYRNRRFADEATLDKIKRFFADNGAFVVESFRHDDSDVTVSVVGDHVKLKNALTGEVLKELATPPPEPRERWSRDQPMGHMRTNFKIPVPPHSYLVFTSEK